MAIEPDALKLSFQLTAHGDHLEVRAASRRGEGRAESPLPPPQLLSQLAQFDPAHMPLAPLQSAGQSLYHCLVVGDVARLAADVLQEARSARQPAQFELRFDPGQVGLAQHPWETIADDLGQFLVRDGLVDVTRYVTYPQPPPALSMAFQDKTLLRVVSQPTQLPPLAIGELPLSCQMLAHATFESLSEKLLIERLALWGLQFDGHGALAQRCPQCDKINLLDAPTCTACGTRLSGSSQVGVLAFESNGSLEWVPAQELGSILYNAQVQLALLLACETARLGGQWMFSGLAPSLMLAGVPAVIGMQYPVSDRFANRFAHSFYAALLRQNDVLVALRVARQMNVQAAWYSPVLYLRHRKATPADEVIRPTYHTRSIDTAAPAQARAGAAFLARLWIRRPQTQPLTSEQLRRELNVPATTPLSIREETAEIKFEPIPVEQRPASDQRKLRRGQVEVKLVGTDCSITPEGIKLFVDEDLDAPPAIFTVRAERPSSLSLIFSLWQEGAQIAAITHRVQVTPDADARTAAIKTGSQTIPVEDAQPVSLHAGRVADELIGKTLDNRYQIVEVIAHGAIATIYRAFQPALGRYVALKVLPARLAADTAFIERFTCEAMAAARLMHPNIVRIHDVGVSEGSAYLVMELVVGESLDAIMRRSGALRPDLVTSIAVQVASALDYAHQRGFVHRDIRPDNIMVGADGHVTLTDFCGVRATSNPQLIGAGGATLGEPSYMSPEQVQGLNVDWRTDIYSLGIVLYQMLAGAAPFAGSSPMQVMLAQVSQTPPPISQANRDVSHAVDAVVLKALAKNREERFHSAGELARALHDAIGGQASDSERPPASVTPVRPVTPPIGQAPAYSPSPPPVAKRGCRPGFSIKGLFPWLVFAIAFGMAILFGVCLVTGFVMMGSR
jgi:hypothetical protein